MKVKEISEKLQHFIPDDELSSFADYVESNNRLHNFGWKSIKVSDILNIIKDCNNTDDVFFYHEPATEDIEARDIIVTVCSTDVSNKTMQINMYEVNDNFNKKTYLI